MAQCCNSRLSKWKRALRSVVGHDVDGLWGPKDLRLHWRLQRLHFTWRSLLTQVAGMVQPETWMHLTPAVVQDIHKKGGTILVSDRGNPPHLDIAKMLSEKRLGSKLMPGRWERV